MGGHHDHDHDHDHEHNHDHDHGPVAAGDNARTLGWVLLLITVFMVVEVIGGLVSGSLALLADAAHMATDAMALALAFFAALAARRPADQKHSYGHQRIPVLAAFVNGFTLILLAGWIIFEAVQRLMSPQPVLAGVMLVVAAGGLLVNLIALRALHGGHSHDINTQGAMAHVIGDLLGSVAAILAAVIVMFTGWVRIDPLLSMLVAGLIIVSGGRLMRRAGHVLLEGVPPGISPAEVARVLNEEIEGIDGPDGIHHVHAWSLAPGKPLVTLHARVAEGIDAQRTLEAIHALLDRRFGVDHATVQIEFAPCPDQPCDNGRC
jgi:cobalt-zinc-cadmium efflux system protein